MAALNTRYLSTNRGIIKILQIIVGIIICSLLCYKWYGGKSCFGEGRLGFASGLNFVLLIVNVVFFFLNFLDLSVYKLERLYSFLGTILLFVALGLVIWWIVEAGVETERLIGSTVLIGVLAILFLYDLKILQGEIAN
jgi:cytosine/uracil/thiamine/allantoin permease